MKIDDKVRTLANMFSVQIAKGSGQDIYGGYIAFYRNGETVEHTLFDPVNQMVRRSHRSWCAWEKGDHVDAVVAALTSGGAWASHPELTKTIREVEKTIHQDVPQMKTFILVNFICGAYLVHIYGIIVAPDAQSAASSIRSKIVRSSSVGSITERHALKESKSAFDEWFIQEVEPITCRPKGRMQ